MASGCDFLRTIFASFRSMKLLAIHKGKPRPYLFKHYNVNELHVPANSNVRSFLARVINLLVCKLNDEAGSYHLPKYVLFIIDLDLIANADLYDYGISRTLEDTLKWLLININEAINTRKDDLMKKRAGAVSSSSEQCIIWVTMLKHPDYSMGKRIFSLCRKFNGILEDVIAGDTRSHIIKVRVNHNNQNFDRNGHLTSEGKVEYWRFINAEMRDFDYGKTELTPLKTSQRTASEDESKNSRS